MPDFGIPKNKFFSKNAKEFKEYKKLLKDADFLKKRLGNKMWDEAQLRGTFYAKLEDAREKTDLHGV